MTHGGNLGQKLSDIFTGVAVEIEGSALGEYCDEYLLYAGEVVVRKASGCDVARCVFNNWLPVRVF